MGENDDYAPPSGLGSQRSDPVSSALKSIFDLVVSAATITVLAPVFLACWVAAKIEDPRAPAVQSHTRVGLDGCEFQLLNFRLRSNARAGRFGATHGLEHLPELVNVLRGDMSIVGPRPLPPDAKHPGTKHPDTTTSDVAGPSLSRSVGVRPGMTGLWTMVGSAELTPEDVASLELEYARTRSLSLDLRIMVETAAAVRGGLKRPEY